MVEPAYAYACPRCDRADKVEKVSTLFSEGMDGDRVLANRIKPPSEPQRPPEKFKMSQNEVGLMIVAGFLTAGIGWIAIPLLLYRAHNNRHAYYVQDYRNWQKAMHRWSEMYYCSRDDVVFAPDADRLVEPEVPRSLPAKCPNCAGTLRADKVKWINERSAICPWCNSTVKTI